MRRLALIALALVGGGCVGPLLPLPPPADGPHSWACRNIACPNAPGVARVLDSEYAARLRVCRCWVEDDRGLPFYTEVDPHAH